MGLIDQMKELIGKDEKLGQLSQWMPSHSSGFDLMDYWNGLIDPDTGEEQVGLDGGKILMMVAKSGAGKSTLVTQIAFNIIEPYEEGQVIHLDFERATKKNRVMALTKLSSETLKKKYIHMDRGISTESVLKLIKAIAKLKKDNKDKLLLPTGRIDEETGNEIMMYPPTVIILDSLAVMAPDNIEEAEEMKGQMSASAIAKANTQLFKRIMGALMDTNIILLVINHINAKIDINPMAKTQAQVNFLKQDETLPGGNAPIYLSNYLFKLVTSKKLEEDKEFGIKGFEVAVQLVKSRSAAAGLSFTLVFDQTRGFNNVISNYIFLKDQKLIKGAGRSYYIDACPNVKWSQKEFEEKYWSNPELKEAFDNLVKSELSKLIPRPELSQDENANLGPQLEYDEESGYWYDAEGNWYDDDGNPVETE